MKTTKLCFCILLSVMLAVSVLPLSRAANDKLILYPEFDERITRDFDYSVSVSQGSCAPETIPVYNRSNSFTLMTDRMENPDYNRRFCEFAFSGGAVTVHITPHCDFRSYSVMPSAKNFPSTFSNGTIHVTVESPDEVFLLKLNNDDNTILSVFADAEESYRFEKDDPSVLYIDEKWAVCSNKETLLFDETSQFVKSTNENGDTVITNIWDGTTPVTTLYIAPGSVLDARVFTWFPGVTICGHGMILDPYSDIFRTDIATAERKRSVVINSGDCVVRDVKLADAQHYNLAIGPYGNNCRVNNIKILSAVISTDGISVFGANDVTVKNCFVYCGDNAFCFGEQNRNNLFENNLIGTTCAAFCPQEDLPYPLLVKNNHVFRCDEGCINYWYCSGETTVADLVFDGLDCVDVNSLPWLFSTRDSGYAEKHFTLKNVSVCNVRGHKTMIYKPNGRTIELGTRDSLVRDSGNYHLTLENFYVDGAPMTCYEDLKISNPVPEENTVTVSCGPDTPAGLPLAPVRHAAASVFPFKVYIGDSLQKMRTQPTLQNGVLYLPYEEICEKLNAVLPQPPALQQIGGVAMISAATLTQHIAKTQYRAAQGEIRIANIENTKSNLLAERSAAFSRWAASAAYQATLTAKKEADSIVYHVKDLKTNGDNGLVTFVTDEIKKNGAAKYVMTFSARSAAGSTQTGTVALKEQTGVVDLRSPLVLGAEWETYTVVFDLPAETDFSACRDFWLSVRNDSAGDFDVELKDLSMTVDTYHPAVPQPETEPSGEPETPPENTQTDSCLCRKSGFARFLCRILLFFRNLFKRHKT